MQVRLKLSIIFGFPTDKSDSHADSRITRANQDPGRDLFWSRPPFRTEASPDGKRQKCFNITATAADVGSGERIGTSVQSSYRAMRIVILCRSHLLRPGSVIGASTSEGARRASKPSIFFPGRVLIPCRLRPQNPVLLDLQGGTIRN